MAATSRWSVATVALALAARLNVVSALPVSRERPVQPHALLSSQAALSSAARSVSASDAEDPHVHALLSHQAALSSASRSASASDAEDPHVHALLSHQAALSSAAGSASASDAEDPHVHALLSHQAAIIAAEQSEYEAERRRHRSAMEGLLQNMSVSTALKQLEQDKGTPKQLLAIVRQVLGRGDAAGAGGGRGRGHLRAANEPELSELEKATHTLNDMIYGVQAKYEAEHQKCCAYERTKRYMQEEAAQDIALFNGESAQGRAGILSSQTQIAITDSRVPKIKEAMRQNKQKCTDEISQLSGNLATVLNDIRVLTSVLEMSDCSKSADHVKSLLTSQVALLKSPDVLKQVNRSLQEVSFAAWPDSRQGLVQESNAPQKPAVPAVTGVGPCTKPTTGTACSVGSGSCELLQERFLLIQAGIADKRDVLKEELSTLEKTCKATDAAYQNQIAAFDSKLMDEQTKLAQWTKVQNGADEQSRLKSVEVKAMKQEFEAMTKTCHENYAAFEAEECGLRKIRGEMMKMNGSAPFFQDCEVSSWKPEECSVSCGGGKQLLTRSVIVVPKSGVKCLPLEMEQSCNTRPCPVDCKVNDWQSWSGCTAECGGGVQQRSRVVDVKPQNGGQPCGETGETRSCNLQSCDQDCVLNEWTEWTACSKACGDGRQRRQRTVQTPARGNGKCAADHEESRLQYKKCNSHECPSELLCASQLDVVVLLDGSNSHGEAGWNATRSAAAMLVTALGGLGGSVGTQVAVMAYSGPTTWSGVSKCTGEVPAPQGFDEEKECKMHWVSHFSSNTGSVAKKIGSTPWPAGGRLTAVALGLAEAELSLGRKEASPLVLVVTAGAPLSLGKTDFMSTKIKKKARLTWITVGYAVPTDHVRTFASEPSDENLIPVTDFDELNHRSTIDRIVADVCPQVTQVSQGAALANPGFELGSLAPDAERKAIEGWTSEKSTVFVRSGNKDFGGLAAPEGSFFLGLENQGAEVTQVVENLKPQQAYTLVFWLAAKGNPTLSVTMDGKEQLRLTPQPGPFRSVVHTVQAPSSKAALGFQNVAEGQGSAALVDGVKLYSQASLVTCTFTVDSLVTAVYYNGEDITKAVVSPEAQKLNDPAVPKQVFFQRVAGAYLVILGAQSSQAQGADLCKTSGLAVTCSDPRANEAESWEAFGAAQALEKTDEHRWGQGQGWKPPCTSESSSTLQATKYAKVWSAGHPFAAFRFKT